MQALTSVPSALTQLPAAPAQWQRTSSVLALPCLAGLGALCQLGWCQGSNSSPPNSRAGAPSSSAHPALTLSLLPLSTARSHPSLCHRASTRVEQGVANPSATQHQPGHSPNGETAQGTADTDTEAFTCVPGQVSPCSLMFKVTVFPCPPAVTHEI